MKIILALTIYLNFSINVIFSTEHELLNDKQFTQDHINNFTAQAAKALYGKLNNKNNVAYPRSPKEDWSADGWKSEKFWSLPGFGNNKFITPIGDNINAALENFFNKATVDCVVAKEFVTLKIIQEFVGLNNFSTLVRIYKEVFEQIVLFDIRYERSFTHMFLEQVNDISLGSLVYLQNHPLYRIVHYDDIWTGFDVFQVGKNNLDEDLFVGFWPEQTPKPRSKKEIYDHFYKALCQDKAKELPKYCSLSAEEVQSQFNEAIIRTKFNESVANLKPSTNFQLSLNRLQVFFEKNYSQEGTRKLISTDEIKKIFIDYKEILDVSGIENIVELSKPLKSPDPVDLNAAFKEQQERIFKPGNEELAEFYKSMFSAAGLNIPTDPESLEGL